MHERSEKLLEMHIQMNFTEQAKAANSIFQPVLSLINPQKVNLSKGHLSNKQLLIDRFIMSLFQFNCRAIGNAGVLGVCCATQCDGKRSF